MNRVAVVGLGYVGLTLSVALARRGLAVIGCDQQPRVVATLPHEPVDAAVICVSTPVDPVTHAPQLEHLRDAARAVAETCPPSTLVVVRSTVPIDPSALRTSTRTRREVIASALPSTR